MESYQVTNESIQIGISALCHSLRDNILPQILHINSPPTLICLYILLCMLQILISTWDRDDWIVVDILGRCQAMCCQYKSMEGAICLALPVTRRLSVGIACKFSDVGRVYAPQFADCSQNEALPGLFHGDLTQILLSTPYLEFMAHILPSSGYVCGRVHCQREKFMFGPFIRKKVIWGKMSLAECTIVLG